MKIQSLLSFLFLCIFNPTMVGATEKENILTQPIDLHTSLPVLDSQVTGFTIIHGSAKAEEVELLLIASRLSSTDTLYYLPEVDAAMGYYFNEYLTTGNEDLLKELITDYRSRVPQEASIAMYEKWRSLRELVTGKYFKVIGTDIPISYRSYVKLLLELMDSSNPYYESLYQFRKDNTTDYCIGRETPLKELMIKISVHYEGNNRNYSSANSTFLDHLIQDINLTLQHPEGMGYRDPFITQNYIRLDEIYSLRDKPQFIRMGVFHLMKERFDNYYPGFVRSLIEEGLYKPSDIFIAQGFLYDSAVLWERNYNEITGEFAGYKIETGEDYTGSSVSGLEKLTEYQLSDMTYFNLSTIKALHQAGCSELLFWNLQPGKSTSYYIDAAILITQSTGNIPIEELVN